jgi:2-methylcitrate dehydratase PrpD
MTTKPTQELADWIVGLRYEDLPDHVCERVAEIFLDTIASALAGQQGDETPQIRAVARALGGDGSTSVIGEGPLSAAGATLLNAYLITAVTVCDVYRRSLCHISPEVVPPALAIAEQLDRSGRDLLVALAAGMEVTTRLGLGLHYPSFRARGWHSPGVIGPFGGAAAAGKLLGLDATQQRSALGLAGAQAAGTFAAWGTPTVKFHQAHGAVAGLTAALLAHQGFEGAREVLAEPDGGVLHTYSDGGQPEAMLADLGSRWELEQISLRPWPAASSIQSEVTALLALAEAYDLQPESIAQVRVGLSPTVYQMHGTQPWDARFHAMLSAPYTAAVVLHDRRCWLEQYDADRLRDPALDAFTRERVVVGPDASVEGTGALVEITLNDGTHYLDRRPVPRGDAADPLTRAEIEAKLRDASAGVLPSDTVERLISLLRRLDQVEHVRELLTLLRAPVAAPVG